MPVPRSCAMTLLLLLQASLGYFGAEESPDVDAAAPGWPGLPLRALDFDSNSGEFRLGAPALDALGRLGSCLTQLALSGGVLVETTPTGQWVSQVTGWQFQGCSTIAMCLSLCNGDVGGDDAS